MYSDKQKNQFALLRTEGESASLSKNGKRNVDKKRGLLIKFVKKY